jgi:hypothetical protein
VAGVLGLQAATRIERHAATGSMIIDFLFMDEPPKLLKSDYILKDFQSS